MEMDQVNILLVEDNPGDARLMEEALKEGKVRVNLHRAQDGEEALRFVRREGEYSAAPRPDLILLDLNLPKRDGREVLQELKEDPRLKRIPIVVMTTSKSDEDVIKCYDLHANSYIQKPVNLDSFIEVIRSVENFWLTVVKLPPSNGKGS